MAISTGINARMGTLLRDEALTYIQLISVYLMSFAFSPFLHLSFHDFRKFLHLLLIGCYKFRNVPARNFEICLEFLNEREDFRVSAGNQIRKYSIDLNFGFV